MADKAVEKKEAEDAAPIPEKVSEGCGGWGAGEAACCGVGRAAPP